MLESPSQHFKVLVWNVQGARSREFRNILREHLQVHRPSIIDLVETRISGIRAREVCDSLGFSRCIRAKAQGIQGGIWVLWNEEDLEVVVLKIQEQFVMVEIKSHGGQIWVLTFIYASPHSHIRDNLWNELQTFAVGCGKPLAGDFNETVSLDERNHGGPEMEMRCLCFKHWIENNDLIDLGFSGPKYTWTRGLTQSTRKEARLDRALCNTEWRMKFQEGAVRHLIQAGSDHAPLLISTGGFARLPPFKKPFRFQIAWTTHHQFGQFIQDKWHHHSPLVANLRDLASALNRWNQKIFGNLFRRKHQLWAHLEGIQRRLDAGRPRYLLKLDRRLRQDLDKTLDQITLLWFQKARVEQIRDGDRNTKYFHTSTIIRRRMNRIDAIKTSDET